MHDTDRRLRWSKEQSGTSALSIPIYGLLMKASSETMLTVAADPQASQRPPRYHRGAAHLGLSQDPITPARPCDRAEWRHSLDASRCVTCRPGSSSLCNFRAPVPTIIPAKAPCRAWPADVLRRPRGRAHTLNPTRPLHRRADRYGRHHVAAFPMTRGGQEVETVPTLSMPHPFVKKLSKTSFESSRGSKRCCKNHL